MKRFVYIALALVGVIMFALLSDNLFLQFKQHNINMQLANDEASVYRLKEHIVERFYKAQQDVIFVAAYLGENSKKQEANTSDEQERVKPILQNIAPSFFSANNIYKSVTYLDKSGNEIASIDINGFATKPVITDKAKGDCLNGTVKHKIGEVYTYFDGTNLFICSPAFNKAGAFSGAIVLILEKEQLLNELQPLINKFNMMLIEDTGKYILTSKNHSAGDFISEYSNDLLSRMISSQSGNFEYRGGTLLTYTSVNLDDHQWFLILSTDKESTTAMVSDLYKRFIGLLVIFIIAIIVMVILWQNSYKKTLIARNLQKQNDQLENMNKELMKKQYELEEQNTVIEELNSQSEDESARFQQQRDMLRAIIDSLGAGIIMTDAAGSITFINKAWKDLFSYLRLKECFNMNEDFYINSSECNDPEQFLKEVMFTITNSHDFWTELSSLLKDPKRRYVVDLEQTDPVRRYLNLYSNPCIGKDEQSFGRVFVFRDVSHQKEVDRLKLELISTVSHELRTPMSSILGFSELLLTRKLSPERNREYIEIISSEAKRLTNLINDFLDIQKMESGKQVFNKHYYPFNLIIEDALKLFKDVDGKHNITYTQNADKMLSVYCDKDKMIQVISNLLSNAIKYSPDGGEIKLDVCVENGKLKTSVTDYGLGIPEDVKDKLFTKFFRVENDDRRKIGGSGLGLAICKEIIRAHEGDIGVESIYGQGSTFCFYISVSEVNKTEAEGIKDEIDLTRTDKMSLLIVEDDVTMVRLIKEILKDEEIELYAVTSGEEALKLANEICFNIIILDIALSGQLNGLDVLRELKSNQSTADIPIIISSIYENKSSISSNDIADYLVKPFEPWQLIKVVQKALNGTLNSKMMVNTDDKLENYILDMLRNNKIVVNKIERSGNMLVITLDGGESFEN